MSHFRRFIHSAARVLKSNAKPIGFAGAVTAPALAFSLPFLGKPAGLVDVSALKKVAKDDNGLLPQPASAKYRTCVVEIYVRGQEFGGSDKSSNGHRYDTIPFANGMINSGMSCQLVHYVHEGHDKFFEVMKGFDAIVVRCNPGQIDADGGSQQKFDNAMRDLRKSGIQVWPSPDVMEYMGAKDALTKIKDLEIGLPDTLSYYEAEAFKAGFQKTMAFQPRVIKQNRGSAGEGIWIIKLKKGNYCANFGDRLCDDNEVLSLMEANDNHSEEHTVGEFVEWCLNGRTAKSGKWTSKGVGKYLEGGKEAGGMIVDQRFCPRIVEGELRYNCVGPELVGIIHKKPKEGGISAVSGTGSVYTFYEPSEPKFANLTKSFLSNDMPKIMPALGLGSEPIPLWWTSDFINSSPPGTPSEKEKWIVGEFNCSCVGISKCLPAFCNKENPNASWDNIPAADKDEAMKMGNKMGEVALDILNKSKRWF
jgi:glutathione synthase/RimK-type ligase-like ATP-grasp enzyme